MKTRFIVAFSTLTLLIAYFTIQFVLKLTFYKTDKIFLIPENYQGSVTLIEDLTRDSVQVHDGKYLFDFRKATSINGSLVLRVKGLFVGSKVDEYYYVDSLGSKSIILKYTDDQKLGNNQVYVYGSESLKPERDTGPLRYNTTIIASLKNKPRYTLQAQRVMDSLVCRIY